MKHYCLVCTAFAILSVCLPSQAQVKRCGTMDIYNSHVKQDPNITRVREAAEAAAKKWRQNNSGKKNAAPVVIIPVVFHVIYNVDSLHQNIPDSVIYSQIDVLNEDFRRLNPDTDDIRSIFDSLSSDIEIEFCLASVDPSGNPTSGIVRTSTNVQAFEFFNNQQDDMKFTSKGGDDAWPKDSYLNIWTCYMTIFNSPGVLGYSHFPWDTAASTDGVVLLYNVVGRYNKVFDMPPGEGKTATHEVGHWFGLFHISGNESWLPGCDSSDYVDDTPNQSGQSNFDCNKNINSCSNELIYWGSQNPPDMVENYMDYSNDTCMCMFSAGQKERMLSFLNTSRAGLFSSTGCSGNTASKELAVSNESFRLFPNPSDGKVTLVSPAKNFRIEIFDLYGRKLYEKIEPGNKQVLDLSGFPAGFYFARAGTADSESVLPLILSGN